MVVAAQLNQANSELLRSLSLPACRTVCALSNPR
jgi:hypothetical protein